MQRDEPREFDQYLTNKVPNLSAAGSRISDLYYDESNSTVDVIESQCDWGYVQALTSPNFGTTSNFFQPLGDFTGICMLHLRLPNLVANQSLARGWGLAAIRSIKFQLGASSTSPITLSKQAIWHFLLSQCSTEEKRSQLLRLCGEEYLLPAVAPPGEDVPTIDAYVPLPFPFSTVCDKLMYDSGLLSQPIQVSVELESSARTFYGGTATPPTAFTVAEFMLRQQRVADKSRLLKGPMMANPALMYSYPFILTQGVQVGPIAGVRASDNGRVLVQLISPMNADLLGITIGVQRVLDTNPTGTDSPNPFHLDDISNILLQYNGSNLFQLPGKSYKAISAYMGDQQASYYQGSVIAPGAAPYISTPVDENLVHFDFTQVRSACIHSHMANCFRIPPGNSLNLSFNTSQGAGTQYNVFGVLYYNSIILTQGGTTEIYTA